MHHWPRTRAACWLMGQDTLGHSAMVPLLEPWWAPLLGPVRWQRWWASATPYVVSTLRWACRQQLSR